MAKHLDYVADDEEEEDGSKKPKTFEDILEHIGPFCSKQY